MSFREGLNILFEGYDIILLSLFMIACGVLIVLFFRYNEERDKEDEMPIKGEYTDSIDEEEILKQQEETLKNYLNNKK